MRILYGMKSLSSSHWVGGFLSEAILTSWTWIRWTLPSWNSALCRPWSWGPWVWKYAKNGSPDLRCSKALGTLGLCLMMWLPLAIEAAAIDVAAQRLEPLLKSQEILLSAQHSEHRWDSLSVNNVEPSKYPEQGLSPNLAQGMFFSDSLCLIDTMEDSSVAALSSSTDAVDSWEWDFRPLNLLAQSRGANEFRRCDEFRKLRQGFEYISATLVGMWTLLRSLDPRLKSQLLLQSLRLGIAGGHPAVLMVTVMGATGMYVLYIVSKVQVEECRQVEMQRLRSQIQIDLLREFHLRPHPEARIRREF